MSFFTLLCTLLVSCIPIPIPYPAVLTPADKTVLKKPSCIRFKGNIYVLGGYHKKEVPSVFLPKFPFSEIHGLQFDSRIVFNRWIYEITDKEEAFIIENSIKRWGSCEFKINPSTWRKIGRIGTWKAIRDSRYYLEFKDHVYAIGGVGYETETERDISLTKFDSLVDVRYADVWVSGDLKNWERIAEKVPWSTETGCRKGHQLAVFDGQIWLAGGSGTSLDGRDEVVSYKDVWKSADGRNWGRAKGRFPGAFRDDRIRKIDNSYFYIENQVDRSSIYVSDDGARWQELLDTDYLAGFLDNRLGLIVSEKGKINESDLYMSTDGLEWRHSRTGEEISLAPREIPGKYYLFSSSKVTFNLVEFDNYLWLIEENLDQVYRSRDGATWERVGTLKDKTMVPRSDAMVAAYGGFLWIMGGTWMETVPLKDIWRSRDGRNWELVTDNAPWGTASGGDLIEAKGRLYLVKKGMHWEPHSRSPRWITEVWSTTDGLQWVPEHGDAHKIIVAADADRMIETRNALYFIDERRHKSFLRDKQRTVERMVTLNNFHCGNTAEVKRNGQSSLFVGLRGERFFCVSPDLLQWGGWQVAINDTDDAGRRIFPQFLMQYDSGVPYQPVLFNDKLLFIGFDDNGLLINSVEMVLDEPGMRVKKISGTASYVGKAGGWEHSPCIHKRELFTTGKEAGQNSALIQTN